jgi:hypothetical protein
MIFLTLFLLIVWLVSSLVADNPKVIAQSEVCVELLTQPWNLAGSNGASEKYQGIAPTALQGKNKLRITYNLNGLSALDGDASAIIFDQNGWRYISLSRYGQNGLNGVQTVDIPLSAFPGLNPNASVGTLHTRFWYGSAFRVDITSIKACGPAPTTTAPTNTGSVAPTFQPPSITSAPTISTQTPSLVPPTLTNTTVVVAATSTNAALPMPTIPPGGVELLSQPWHLVGNNGASEKYQGINPAVLAGKDTIRITYDLHGLRPLGLDASAIIFDQNGWRYISLSNYGMNGLNGVQTVDIPLTHFPSFNLNQGSNTIHTRFWYGSAFTVDIYSIVVFSTQTATPTNAPSTTHTPSVTSTWTPILPTLPPTVNSLPPCPAGTGPNGIRAGGYPPFRLTQDERQWLFNIFGNAGTAPVGYGGQPCGVDYGSGEQNFFAMVCARGNAGPGGIRPGGYTPQNLTQDQRQWLWNEFRESGGGGSGIAPVGYGGQGCPNGQQLRICPIGTGPGGILAGGYTPQNLTQEQRQWLWEQFGHSGTAPVGYGGEPCERPTPTPPPQLPPCPPGVGAPGSFDPTTLMQQQRNELFAAFGHLGQAPVGYGGEACSGGTMTLPSFITTTPTRVAATTTSPQPTAVASSQSTQLPLTLSDNCVAVESATLRRDNLATIEPCIDSIFENNLTSVEARQLAEFAYDCGIAPAIDVIEFYVWLRRTGDPIASITAAGISAETTASCLNTGYNTISAIVNQHR